MPTYGYLDLAGAESRPPMGIAQRLMNTRLLPRVYERWWRPALGRVVKGPAGPSMADEVRSVRRLLALRPGETVLDVACGPGNLTRPLAADVAPNGTAIGVDVSAAMLARAVAETSLDHVVFVRADIADLALRQGSVDAVCCFAALHLFADPERALDVMVDALAPNGRLAILTTARPANRCAAWTTELAGRVTGIAVFGADELARHLSRRGLEVSDHRRFGTMQLVGAYRPAPNGAGRHLV